VIYCYC